MSSGKGSREERSGEGRAGSRVERKQQGETFQAGGLRMHAHVAYQPQNTSAVAFGHLGQLALAQRARAAAAAPAAARLRGILEV